MNIILQTNRDYPESCTTLTHQSCETLPGTGCKVNCPSALSDLQHPHISVSHLQHTQKDLASTVFWYYRGYSTFREICKIWQDSEWLNLHSWCLLVGMFSNQGAWFHSSSNEKQYYVVLVRPCFWTALDWCHKQRWPRNYTLTHWYSAWLPQLTLPRVL